MTELFESGRCVLKMADVGNNLPDVSSTSVNACLNVNQFASYNVVHLGCAELSGSYKRD